MGDRSMVGSMKYFRKLFLAATVASVLTLQPVLADHHKAAGQTAVAVLETTNQRVAPQARVLGEVRFQQMGDKIHITGRLEGLEPNSVHGFHIHQYGDLTARDGTSAGGHFSPEGHPHAGPEAGKHHAGDLGNVTADKNGVVVIDQTVDFITLANGKSAVIGRSVVLHGGKDDLSSQPSGAAGPRIGVGVIGWANSQE